MKKIICVIGVLLLISMPVQANSFEIFMDHGAIMLMIDPENGAIKFANHAASDFYGYSIDVLETMNISMLNMMTDAEVEIEYRKASKEERHYFEFDHRLKNQSIRQVAVYSYPIFIGGQDLLFSIIFDVTDVKDNQRKLALAQEKNEKSLKEIILIISFALTAIGLLMVRLVVVNKRLRFLTTYDALTNVYNRQTLMNKYKKLKDKKDFPLYFFMFDVNNLKFINDTFGHGRGDEMIVEVASQLRGLAHRKACVGRVSGDEFVAYLPGGHEADALAYKSAIESLRINVCGVDFSVAVGCTCIKSSQRTFQEAFSRTEKLMYGYKQSEKPLSNQRILDQLMKKMTLKDPCYPRAMVVRKLILDGLGQKLDFEGLQLDHLYEAILYQDLGGLAHLGDLREHPQKTYGILNTLNMPGHVATACFYHHESYGGGGYPKGLIGEEIPLNARVLTLVNAVYACVSQGLSLQALKDNKDLDPNLVNKVLAHPRLEINLDDIKE